MSMPEDPVVLSTCTLKSQLGKWDYDSVKLLIETLLTVSGENDVEKLRKPIPSTVWDSVGTRINIHPSKCKSYWNNKLSTQLFARDPCGNRGFQFSNKRIKQEIPFHSFLNDWPNNIQPIGIWGHGSQINGAIFQTI
uniref:Uncharacterized protein n=1 Tax=Timema cristinae TaxID=61476 RepID=A0A7R9CQP1_TIMCR|nr:unnamed protein product [Timema cristinae]